MEVFPLTYDNAHLPPDFLHVCGGVSSVPVPKGDGPEFSPRMWRCFQKSHGLKQVAHIFSTYVEVFPLPSTKSSIRHNFLHVCGGVSFVSKLLASNAEFSPRMWRCFSPRRTVAVGNLIFSTYVEVFLRRFDILN